MTNRKLGPQPFLRTFAEGISSASDSEFAAWQEQGIEYPRSALGILIWSILVSSSVVGATCGVLLFLSAWHALSGFNRPLPPHASRLADPVLLLALALLIVAIVAGVISFLLFHALSRVIFIFRRSNAA